MNERTPETKVRRRARIVLNILIVGFGGLLAFLIVQGYFNGPNRAIHLGDRVNLKSLKSDERRNVFIFLKSDCVYCTKDAPFYRSLFTHLKQSNSIRFVTVFSRNDTRSTEYLAELGLSDADSRSDSFANLGVTGTPIVAITDQTGKVEHLWRGSLSHKQETEVKLALGFEAPSSILNAGSLQEFVGQGRQIEIVDVRPKDLYLSDSVPGARNIPLDELAIRGVNELPESATIVVYGLTEKDGEDAQEILSQNGFSNVFILARDSS